MSEEERNITQAEPAGEAPAGMPSVPEGAAPEVPPEPAVELPSESVTGAPSTGLPEEPIGDVEAEPDSERQLLGGTFEATSDTLSGPEPLSTNDDDRLMAALAWFSMALLQLPLISVVLLIAHGNRERPFQRYHAITSILFWCAAAVYEALAGIAFVVLTVLSLGCLAVCLWVVFFLPHLIALYYAFQSYNGKRVEIPVISDFARGQGWVEK